ncbi:MAG: DUF5615 family PIN-like protein [Oscillospiraceae bacterium]|nr:DUF5615 family PIN-like protein [Oscillospiraceae bacterium]
MKLLLDMNIPLKYQDLLRNKGLDVVRWSEVGASNAEDIEIMSYARNNDYIVLTCDLDFSAILATTHELKPSVVQTRASVIYAETAVDLITTALKNNNCS